MEVMFGKVPEDLTYELGAEGVRGWTGEAVLAVMRLSQADLMDSHVTRYRLQRSSDVVPTIRQGSGNQVSTDTDRAWTPAGALSAFSIASFHDKILGGNKSLLGSSHLSHP